MEEQLHILASDWDQPTNKGNDRSNLGMDSCHFFSYLLARRSNRAVRCKGRATCLDLGGGYRDHANLRWELIEESREGQKDRGSFLACIKPCALTWETCLSKML